MAHEPLKIVNPDKNTKIEVVVLKRAEKFGGNLDIVKGEAQFEVILCDEKGKELKRTKVSENGDYNFGSLDSGKYFLKLENTLKKPPKEFVDKAAPNIMDIPYLRENKLEF